MISFVHKSQQEGADQIQLLTSEIITALTEFKEQKLTVSDFPVLELFCRATMLKVCQDEVNVSPDR